MAVYSWQLTILIWVCFLPLFATMRLVQKRTGQRYSAVRQSIGGMLGAIGESLVGRPGGAGLRHRGADSASGSTQAIDAHPARPDARAAGRRDDLQRGRDRGRAGQRRAWWSVGMLLGVGGHLTVGPAVAMLFLVSLFITPVQWGVEVLNEAQNAISGWRRVIGLLEAVPDVPDPGADGRRPARGPGRTSRFEPGRLRLPGRRRWCCATSTRRSAPRSPDRRGRRDRLRQDHLRQAAHPADGPDRRRGPGQRRGPAPNPVRAAAPAGGDGPAGRLPVRRRRSPTTSATARRSSTTPRWSRPSRLWASATGWPVCRRAWPPRSASAASRCPQGSGSWSRWSARTSPTRTCCCSTRPPPPSTRPPSCACRGPSRRSPAAAPRSPSRTACPPPRPPTRCSCSTPGELVERGPHQELVAQRRDLRGAVRLVGPHGRRAVAAARRSGAAQAT